LNREEVRTVKKYTAPYLAFRREKEEKKPVRRPKKWAQKPSNLTKGTGKGRGKRLRGTETKRKNKF